jgi:hypothetical protein
MWKTITLLKSFIVSFLFSFQSIGQTYIPPEFSSLKQKEFLLPKHYSLKFDSLSYSSLTYKKDLSFSIFSNQYLQSKIDSTKLGIKTSYQKHLLRNEYSSFWKKAGRGELLIGGIEIIGMITLMLMPKEVTKWEPGWIKAAEKNILRAFSTPPVWDKDGWCVNYIGHPIAGSYYYNVVRSQDATRWQSFLFATVQSCIWEFVIEGSAERPSIQDLVVTPIAGALIGEPIHLATMSMRKNGFRFFEKVFVLLFNPMFVINNGFGPKHNPPLKKNF